LTEFVKELKIVILPRELQQVDFTGMCRESPVPKAFGIGWDESTQNETSILIAGMPCAVCGNHHK
jgi:hypothetical protein